MNLLRSLTTRREHTETMPPFLGTCLALSNGPANLDHTIISQLSNILRGLTGRWLDYEVAVLTEIAFDEPEIDSDQVIWVRRGVKRSTPGRKRTK
jgi:hypothetical protein